jgi:signal transduction histidine kinase
LLHSSHELRTPLTVLQGAIELERAASLRDGGASERRLERMERSVVRMQHTVECLLWLAHEENRTLSMSQEEFLRALDGLIAEWRAVLPPEVHLATTVESDGVPDAPLHLWLVAIRNLIENAAHHTDSGSIEVAVGSDRIRISDTGEGISEEMLSNITETWVHGPQTRGYGLGLSIVNRIAMRMGWSLKIESQVGQGTVVTMEREQQHRD